MLNPCHKVESLAKLRGIFKQYFVYFNYVNHFSKQHIKIKTIDIDLKLTFMYIEMRVIERVMYCAICIVTT